MRELAMQAANGTLNTQDRTTMDTEYQALGAEISRIASQTEFNGINLLDGTVTSTLIQVGIDASQTISIVNQNVTVSSLGMTSSNVTTISNANGALSTIDTAINTINTARGNLGAAQNRMQSALASILNARENLSAAESRIRDVDVASETADLTRNSIMQQAAVSVLQQANVQPQIALSLLQG